jgi:hypothetical protein
MDFRYLLDSFKTLCIAFLCMAFLGHHVIADEVIESAAPIKQTAFFKNTGDISDRELTDKLAEILKETSKAKSVEITGHFVIYDNTFKTLKADSYYYKYSHNGNFIIEHEAVTDKVILEKYKNASQETKLLELARNDQEELYIWDGEFLTIGGKYYNLFNVQAMPVDLKNKSDLLDYGRIVIEALSLYGNIALADLIENLQKEFKADVDEEEGQIFLTLKPRTKKYKKNIKKIIVVFDIKNKEIVQIRIKDASGTTETVFFIDSIDRSPDELEIDSEQVLEKYKSKYGKSYRKENGIK